jgi:hypothetical protein
MTDPTSKAMTGLIPEKKVVGFRKPDDAEVVQARRHLVEEMSELGIGGEAWASTPANIAPTHEVGKTVARPQRGSGEHRTGSAEASDGIHFDRQAGRRYWRGNGRFAGGGRPCRLLRTCRGGGARHSPA